MVAPLVLGEPKPLQLLQPTREQPTTKATVESGGYDGHLDSPVAGKLDELAIKAGPALLADLTCHSLAHLALGLDAKLLGSEFGAASAQAVADVLAGDDEIGARLIDAAQNDVGVRVIGVPMIDRDPVQLRS